MGSLGLLLYPGKTYQENSSIEKGFMNRLSASLSCILLTGSARDLPIGSGDGTVWWVKIQL